MRKSSKDLLRSPDGYYGGTPEPADGRPPSSGRFGIRILGGAVVVLAAFGLARLSPGFFLVVPAGLIVFALALRIGRTLIVSLGRAKPPALPSGPIPRAWREIATNNLPLFARLSASEQERLLRLAQLFVAEKHFEGCGGFEITDEVKVTIAAQACLLLLGSAFTTFPTLRTILVYPDAYEAADDGHELDIFDDGILATDPEVESREGESWDFGTVVLSWTNVIAGQQNPADGRNLVLHEFAHQRDLESGRTDGIPLLAGATAQHTWGAVMEASYERLRRDVSRGRRTVIDEYGATNRSEFFAVATEAFFEKPVQLRRNDPQLYEEMVRFYGVDAAAWFDGRSIA